MRARRDEQRVEKSSLRLSASSPAMNSIAMLFSPAPGGLGRDNQVIFRHKSATSAPSPTRTLRIRSLGAEKSRTMRRGPVRRERAGAASLRPAAAGRRES